MSKRPHDADTTASESRSHIGELIGLARDFPIILRYSALVAIVVGFGTAFIADDLAIPAVVLVFLVGMLAHIYNERDGKARGFDPDRLKPVPGQPARVGVLSFAEVGTAGDEEAYGDGFAEELITRLSTMDGLRLVPRRSMLAFKGRRLSTEQIAERLDVNYLVEGTLRRHGDDCRVDVDVIQAWNGEPWRRQWTGTWSELFTLQSNVAEGVAGHLLERTRGDAALGTEERSALRRSPARNVAAHSAYMRGRANLRRYNNGRDTVHLRSAERAFMEALEQDPGYVDARAELGFLYLLQWETDGGREWLERSELAFQRVRRQQPDHPVAGTELGYIAYIDGRVDEALALAEASAKDHPDETIPQNVLALLYLYVGFYESTVHRTEHVTTLDPNYVYPPTNASTACLLMGRYDDALRWAKRAEAIDPTAFVVALVEGAAWFHMGKLDSAEDSWRRGLEFAPAHIDPLFEVTLAWIDARRGRKDAARTAAIAHRDDEWLHGAYDAYFIGLCALAGELDLALEFLRRQTTWAGSYRYLLGDPNLRALHQHAEFHALLEERHTTWTRLEDRWTDLPLPPPPLPAPEAVAASPR